VKLDDKFAAETHCIFVNIPCAVCTGRAKKSNPLGKILYLWNCSRYIYQICRDYRWGL